MLKRNSLASIVLGMGLCAGCSTRATDKAAVREPSADHPVIGQLVARDRTITMRSSPDGVVYSVQTGAGAMLLDHADEAEFQAKLPEIYRQLKSAEAAAAAALPSLAADMLRD